MPARPEAPADTSTSSDEDGTFEKRFAQGKPLNQPWGLASGSIELRAAEWNAAGFE